MNIVASVVFVLSLSDTHEANIGDESAIFGVGQYENGELMVFEPTADAWRRLDVRQRLHKFHPKNPHYVRRVRLRAIFTVITHIVRQTLYIG
jgi:hypothetical protein